MQTNLKPNSCLAKAGTLFFDYLVIFAGAVLYGISVAMFTSPNNVAPGGCCHNAKLYVLVADRYYDFCDEHSAFHLGIYRERKGLSYKNPCCNGTCFGYD